MLAPSHFCHDEIVALDRAYINYEKFEELTDRNVIYLNMNTFFNMPDADMKLMLEEAAESPPSDAENIYHRRYTVGKCPDVFLFQTCRHSGSM